jgi:hypothetical protein
MAKVLVIPDARLDIKRISHGLYLAKRYGADTIVLIGNYFDPIEGEEAKPEAWDNMWSYLKNIIKNNTSIIPLLGERELSYLNHRAKMPGYNPAFSSKIGNKLMNHYSFMPCVAIDGILYSNSGVTTEWLRKWKIMLENDIRFRLGKNGGAALIEKAVCRIPNWDAFYDGKLGTASCMRASVKDLMNSAPANITQVVGNAMVEDVVNMGRIWFVNSVKNDQYLIINNGVPQVYLYLGKK